MMIFILLVVTAAFATEWLALALYYTPKIKRQDLGNNPFRK
jgi:hypothetical protein